MAKSRYFQSRLKFGLQSRFWPLLTCEGWNFAKSRNFDSCQKFKSKLTFLTTRDMQRMKCGKIQKFSIAIKIKPKIESFDHSGHAKDEIWQNPEIFSHAENLAIKIRVLTTLNQRRMKFDKIQKNFDLCWKSGSKNRFLTTPDLRRMKFGKIQIFSVALRIWLEIKSLTTPDLRRMTFCKVNILIHVKNLAQNWHFWPLATCEGWNLAKSRNF